MVNTRPIVKIVISHFLLIVKIRLASILVQILILTNSNVVIACITCITAKQETKKRFYTELPFDLLQITEVSELENKYFSKSRRIITHLKSY